MNTTSIRTRVPGAKWAVRLLVVVGAMLAWAQPASALCDPLCVVSPHELVVRPGDPIQFRAAAYAGVICFHDTKISMIARPPFMRPAGHKIGKSTIIGEIAVIEVKQIAGSYRPGTYWVKFEARDLETGKTDVCARKITLLPPICKETPTVEVVTTEPLKATVGDEFVDFTVCAAAGCDDEHVTIVGKDLPGFVGLVGQSRDDEGRCCVTYRIYACNTDVGTHTLTFEAYNDGGGGAAGEATVEVTINGAEEPKGD